MSTLNDIQKQAGWATLDFANWSLRDAYQVKDPTIVNFGGIANIVRNTFPNMSVGQRDFNFALTTWNIWEDFLGNVPTQKKIKYYAEKFDCDNFAYYTSVMSSLCLLLNSCGRVYCQVYRKDNGQFVAGHYCNLIPTATNDVHLFDLNNSGGWAKCVLGKDPVIGNWEYRGLDNVEFF